MGRACAVALAQEGCNVALFARRRELLDEAVAEIEALGSGAQALAVAGDSAVPADLEALVARTLERFGRLEGLRLAYIGDGNNVARSLVILGELAGMEVEVSAPPELALDGRPAVSPEDAARGAHALYADVWVSMGDEDDAECKRALLAPYRLDEALMAQARDDAIALHCLPAHRNEEITDEVMDGPQSVVFDQAENRLHAQKAILTLFLGTEPV